MPPFNYNAVVESTSETALYAFAKKCIYCRMHMTVPVYRDTGDDSAAGHTTLLSVCPACGWWAAWDELRTYLGEDFEREAVAQKYETTRSGAIGSLCEFDVSAPDAPIQELRQYLRAKYESRFAIDPWRFEQVVASIYRDLGYEVRVTARSNDGGIDVILDGPGDVKIGIQVKRYKDAIKVEQIHSLAGALVEAGMACGVFITTSRFQPGASRAASALGNRGLSIELVDAAAFFDALGVAQLSSPADYHETPLLHLKKLGSDFLLLPHWP